MRAPIANRKSAIRKSSVFSLKSSLLTLVAVIAASVFLFAWAIPPRPPAVDVSQWGDLAARTVAGAYHVHTTRSDGLGDRTAVASAAARAGLKFVILTDHGDATRPPDPPGYLEGVLVLDGVEISTDQGHYVAFDMPRAPYPLGGAARDGGRGRGAARRVRRRGPPGFAQAAAALDRRSRADRRHRVAQHRQRVARRIHGTAGARGDRLLPPPRTGAGQPVRSSRHAGPVGSPQRESPGRRPGGRRRARRRQARGRG